jgi:hypothetical protein
MPVAGSAAKALVDDEFWDASERRVRWDVFENERTTPRGRAAPRILRKNLLYSDNIPIITTRIENGIDFENFLELLEDVVYEVLEDGRIKTVADVLTERLCKRTSTLEPVICSFSTMQKYNRFFPEGLLETLFRGLDEADAGDVEAVADGFRGEDSNIIVDAFHAGSNLFSTPTLMVGKPVQENGGETDVIGSNSISTPTLTVGEPVQAKKGEETDAIDSNLFSIPTLMVGEPVQPGDVQFCGPPPTGRIRRIPYSSGKPPLYPRKKATRHPAANVGRRKRKGEEEEGTGPSKKRRRLDKPLIPFSTPYITSPVDEESTESSNGCGCAKEEDDDMPLFGERLLEDFDAGDVDFGVDGSDFYFINSEAECSNISGGLNKDECSEDFAVVGDDSTMEVDTGSDFGIGCGVGSASTLVGEPGDSESSDNEELLGTIWVPHGKHGFVRHSARLASLRIFS